MLNNYERIKIKRLELSGKMNYWKKSKNENSRISKFYPSNKRISEKVRKIRGNRTLAQFGTMVGVSLVSISKYENELAIPRDNVIKKIIGLNDKGDMTSDEFLYGFPREYIEDIFGEIRDLLDGDRANFYEVMEEFLIDNTAYYGYEDSLISKAIEFFPSLKFSPDFIVLARLYGVEKQNVHLLNFNVNKYEQSKDSNYRYEVEFREEFHTYIMPLLEKELHKFDDLEEVASRLKYTFSLLEFEKQNKTD